MSCPSCGSEVPGGARFCPECGHAVAGRGDERRVATVLFADLAGFTGLSEALDPEHLKNLVDRCFARLALDVTNHGGRVDKVVGDAIVALFGAPVAHEDDAERAVRTGLQMQQTIAALAAETGLPLQLRVGVNSGEVLVGAMRAGGDYTAMGDTVNVASRLQTMAAPGAVVVGPATHAATARVVRYERLGALQARGREAPVDAWRALESLSVPGRRPRRTESPLVGRDDELTVLRQTVSTSIRRARPALAFLLGEAGIGKSRLVDEVAGWAAAEHGALVLEGRCVPYGEANPWWPIAEAVRRACGVDPRDSADVTAAKVHSAVSQLGDAGDDREVAQLAAGLLHLMGDEDALPEVDPQRARQEAGRALHGLIAGLARRQPVVLVLSELHWADEVVLDVLGWHLDRLSGLPLVVLVTSRFELMDRWAPPHGRFNLLTLHLDPLDPAATSELAARLGAERLPAGVVEALVQRSGGNPFFLEELLTFVGEDETGELPVTLRGLVAARIDALPDDERSVLEDAAVIGRSGTLTILTALSRSRGVDDVEGVVDRLFDRDLLAASDGRWEFRSEVVQEVAYGTLTKSERARRHWRVGSWLSAAGRETGRTDELLELVAHHRATAAELVREVGSVPSVPDDAVAVALEAVERAASWASRRELPTAAIRLLDRGVALADPGSPDECRFLLARAHERAALRETPEARQDLDRARPGDDGELIARRLLVLGVVLQVEGDLPGSADTLERAVAAWRQAGNRAGEGEALRCYGLTCMLSADAGGAERALGAALDIARDLGSRRDEAWAMWHLAELSFYAGRPAEAEERLRLAGRAFQEAGDLGGMGWVKGLLGYLRLVDGDREEAEQLALGILEELRDRGDRWALGMVLLLLASVHLWQGRASVAAGEAAEAGGAFVAIHDRSGEMRAAGIRARALAATGRAAEAWEVVRSVAGCGNGTGMDDPDLAAAGVAVHLGEGLLALDFVGPVDIGAFADEAEITRAAALLQAGRAGEAVAVLGALGVLSDAPVGDDSRRAGVLANGWATLALARSCAGDPAGAVEAAERAMACGPAATYRDRVLALLARACAELTAGDAERARAGIREARLIVSGTDDVVTAAVVALAEGRLDEAAGGTTGATVATEAAAQLASYGAAPDGWERVLAAALRGLAPA